MIQTKLYFLKATHPASDLFLKTEEFKKLQKVLDCGIYGFSVDNAKQIASIICKEFFELIPSFELISAVCDKKCSFNVDIPDKENLINNYLRNFSEKDSETYAEKELEIRNNILNFIQHENK